MKHKSKLIIIIASYLLLSTHINAGASIYNKSEGLEDVSEKYSKSKKGQRDKLLRANFAFKRGNLYLRSKEYSKAILKYNAVIKYKPDCAEAYYCKGLALSALYKHNDAIDNYDLSIKYKPDYVEAYYNKGFALYALGRHHEVIENCDLAIKYDPEYSPSYYNKAVALLILGRYKEAIENYDLAIKYDPEYSPTYNNNARSAMAFCPFSTNYSVELLTTFLLGLNFGGASYGRAFSHQLECSRSA